MLYMAVVYILVHSPGGHEIGINAKKIIAMRSGHGEDGDGKNSHLVNKHVHCVIHTEDGKFFGVIETCENVRHAVEQLGLQ